MDPILKAIRKGDEEAISRLLDDVGPALLEAAEDNGNRPLKIAAELGQLGVVKLLVQRGANVNATGFWRRTALHEAADRNHEEMVAFLLEQGAEANGRDRYQTTPLSLACRRGHCGVVQMLLQHLGAQGLDQRDQYGRTALHFAARWGHEQLVRILLLAGADPSVMDNEGKTPLTLAQEGLSEDSYYGSLDEEERRELKEGCAKCVAVFEWWEGELERRHLLERARCLHDASMTQRDQPTSQVPTYLEARAAAGHALPRVEVVLPESEEQQGEEEQRHAMLEYVVKALNQELLTELLEGFY